jgi:D-glycero-alpha-D-manno-heptose-7-phosphate kinase
MIVVRSPLRISLGGGATDLPSFYRKHEGFLIAAAIDKYVYITVHRAFVPKFILKYSKLELVDEVSAIEHPLIREALRLVGIERPHLEITSMADIPAGTGLGSSGSFTTALLKGLHTLKNHLVTPQELAEQACRIEIDILAEPVGKQDQYIAALGGITSFRFLQDDRVEAASLPLAADVLYELEDNLLLFFTGFNRRAATTLKEQDEKGKQNDTAMLEELHFTKEMGFRSREALESGNLPQFAELMNSHWERKKRRSPQMSNADIDRWYELARRQGALGGKLVGAGGGGFLMFYAEDRARLRRAMREAGLPEVRFRFDFEGTKVLVNS